MKIRMFGYMLALVLVFGAIAWGDYQIVWSAMRGGAAVKRASEMGTFMQLCVSYETHNCMNVRPPIPPSLLSPTTGPERSRTKKTFGSTWGR